MRFDNNLFVAIAAILSTVADASNQACGHTETAKYHVDSACDRAAYNRFRDGFNRGASHRRLKSTGVRRVPGQKTVVCPTQVADLSHEDALTGFDTVWNMENSASTPVVVAFVKDGVEYSAMNAKITPPNLDPKAILQPGQHRSFVTYESHVFHVRSLLADGSMGPVLLQHRAGLINIKNRYGPPLSCDPNEPDPEPIVVETGARAPEFSRTPTQVGRPCNTIDLGFRNQVGCPVNIYYAGMEGANLDTGDAACSETFKFHMGVNPRPNDFMWDWDSQTKYEGTYVGHKFVFRLAKDPSVLLDQVEVQPTIVSDCPNLKQKNAIKSSFEVMSIGTMHNIMLNGTNTFANTNATMAIPMHQPVFNLTAASLSKASYYMARPLMSF